MTDIKALEDILDWAIERRHDDVADGILAQLATYNCEAAGGFFADRITFHTLRNEVGKAPNSRTSVEEVKEWMDSVLLSYYTVHGKFAAELQSDISEPEWDIVCTSIIFECAAEMMALSSNVNSDGGTPPLSLSAKLQNMTNAMDDVMEKYTNGEDHMLKMYQDTLIDINDTISNPNGTLSAKKVGVFVDRYKYEDFRQGMDSFINRVEELTLPSTAAIKVIYAPFARMERLDADLVHNTVSIE